MKYIIRLDDACEYMNQENWCKMEKLLSKYNVKPLVGIIPSCKDPDLLKYEYNELFWDVVVKRWINKNWAIALHGYEHVFHQDNSSINPVNNYSEFSGLPLDKQREKIEKGIEVLKSHNVNPKVFFAPAHTFDTNTLLALELSSDIRIISDTPCYNIYFERGFTFVPQQVGRVRKTIFAVTTFCYHPNSMSEKDFIDLDYFLKNNKFSEFPVNLSKKKKGILDRLCYKFYFMRRNRNAKK